MGPLFDRALDFNLRRWAVVKLGHATGSPWLAAHPGGVQASFTTGDKRFDSHAEAIAYADKEARK